MKRSLALLIVLLLGGCSGIPLGRLTAPEIYPDRTEDESGLHTFLWAWNTGDVSVLRTVVGAYLLLDLEKQIETNGVEATSAYYRGEGDMALEELEWKDRLEALAYARIVLLDAKGKRFEMRVSMLRRPDGWVVTARRPLR